MMKNNKKKHKTKQNKINKSKPNTELKKLSELNWNNRTSNDNNNVLVLQQQQQQQKAAHFEMNQIWHILGQWQWPMADKMK